MKTKVTSSINEAAREIRKGNVAAFPTETVYGLGASAFDKKAVKKIFKAKNRPADNPMIVHIWSTRQLLEVASEITPTARKLVKKFFPGSLSIVVKKSPRIPYAVTGGLETVCVRMPSLPLARNFIKACGVPVAAPSANLSGHPSPTRWEHVVHDMRGRIPIILKGPPCKHGLESTVVDCTRSPPVLLRPGAVPVEEIQRALGSRIALHRKGEEGGKAGESASPGMRYRHYAPDAKVILVHGTRELPKKKGKWAFIGFSSSPLAFFSATVENDSQYAGALYSFLRKCDELNVELVYAQKPSQDKEIGRALLDRLVRASKK